MEAILTPTHTSTYGTDFGLGLSNMVVSAEYIQCLGYTTPVIQYVESGVITYYVLTTSSGRVLGSLNQLFLANHKYLFSTFSVANDQKCVILFLCVRTFMTLHLSKGVREKYLFLYKLLKIASATGVTCNSMTYVRGRDLIDQQACAAED